MSKKNDDKRGLGEFRETAFYAVLPLLCAASLLRGCSAMSAEVPEAMRQTPSAQQHVSDAAEEMRAADPKAEPEETAVDVKAQETVTVRPNPYNPANFSYMDEISENIGYFDENYESLQGIDVSDHQGEIDWEAVADAGYEFVFVRVGYRGYGEGTLNEDSMAVEYMQGAEAAGLEVGAYFFSQALDEEEAAEEALFAVDVIKRSGVKMTLPLVYDPEFIEGTQGRADNLSREQISANAQAFREAAENAMKCKTALYTNLYWENNCFDNETLNGFEIWYADYNETPQTPYHFTWWQYSETGSVPGIKGEMDLNLWIKRVD
ncbi:MAG: glycoside hydrolase family 25 protein [Lachnospiraceae bacterium]|nr:glycoside hydrolase family 25 protein [Lachnospiraceae bacterium]